MADTQGSNQADLQGTMVTAPQAGRLARYTPQEGQIYQLDFDLAEQTAVVTGSDLRIDMEDGAVLIFEDFATADSQGNAPLFVMEDGSSIPGNILLALLSGEPTEEVAAGEEPQGGGSGEYDDNMGESLTGIDKLGTQDPDTFPTTQADIPEDELIPINQPPTIETDGSEHVVYESGLVPDGSGQGPTTIVVNGTFTIADPDGLDDIASLTLGDTLMVIGGGPGEFASLADMVGETFDLANGTVELTGYADGVFSYTYTLTDPTIDVDGVPETDSFDVIVADEEAAASATITIEIVDDVPLADNEGVLATVDDNVANYDIGHINDLLDGDIYGADGPATTTPIEIMGNGSLGGTVTIDGSGNLIYNPTVNVDPDGANLTETFTYQITDGDGDTAVGIFQVTLTDTKATIGDPTDSAIDEEGLDGGNPGDSYPPNGTAGDLAGTKTSVSDVDLDITWGTDDGAGRSVTFDATQTGLTGLSSGGDPVSFTLIDDGATLIGYTGTEPTATDDPGVVFYATLSDAGSGSYDFILVAPLDHTYVSNQENDLDLTFSFTALDAEGEGESDTFTVTVDDDAPTTDNEGVLDTVDDNVSNYDIGHIDDLLDGDSYGADGAAETNAITIVGNGTLGGTVTIDGSGNLLYTPAVDVDPDGADQTETFTYQIKDADGDTQTATFQVTVTDTKATIGDPTDSAVDEEGLSGGNPGDSYISGDLAGTATSVSGVDLDITWGGDDGPGRSVTFDATQTGLAGLTSGGDPVSFTIIDSGATLIGYTGSVPTATTDPGVVFYATLSEAGSGSYDFTLVQPLDHDTANTEDDEPLTFSFTALDDEGEGESDTFTVIVDDDAPVIEGTEDAMMVNVPGNPLSADLGVSYGADGPGDVSLTGYTYDDGGGATIVDLTGLVEGEISDIAVLGNDGTQLMADGIGLVYKLSGGVLQAVMDPEAEVPDGSEYDADHVAFTVSIDATDGTYAVNIVDGLDGAAEITEIGLTGGDLNGGNVYDFIKGNGIMLEVSAYIISPDEDNPGEFLEIPETVNYKNIGMGVGQGASIDGEIFGEDSDVLHMEFYNPDTYVIGGSSNELVAVNTAEIKLQGFDDGETGKWIAYGADGTTVVASGEFTVSDVDVVSNQYSFLTIDTGGQYFSMLEFQAEGGNGYSVNTIALLDVSAAYNSTVTYNFEAADYDTDTMAGTFDVTFDGDTAITGSDGADVIKGSDLSNFLVGGDGDDLLVGDLGNDILTGDGGADVFGYTQGIDEGDDTITDFDLGDDALRFYDVLDTEEDTFLDSVLITADSSSNPDVTLTSPDGTSIMIEGINAESSPGAADGMFDSYANLGDFLDSNPGAINIEFDPDNFAS